MALKACEGCGEEFESYYPTQRFCRRQCWLKTHNVPGATHSRKGNEAATPVLIEKLRGSGTKGYVKEHGRHQHRVVAERMLGRPLKSTEIVHHKNGDKHDNREENLEIMTQSEHIRLHAPKRKARR